MRRLAELLVVLLTANLAMIGVTTFVLVPLAGHTPGSFGAFVKLHGGQRALFIGDAAWNREAIRLPSHKLKMLHNLTDSDDAATSDTLWHLHHLAEHDPALLIVPTHDGDACLELGLLQAAGPADVKVAKP